MRRLKFRNFALTFVLFTLFFISVVGQIAAGFHAHNEELIQHQQPPLTYWSEYLVSGHFISSLSENMESEFLQMTLFVYLTAFLVQQGSAESKKPPEEKSAHDFAQEQKEEEYSRQKKKAHPVLWTLYENSLTLSLLFLFLVSFIIHAWGSFHLINQQNQMTGQKLISFSDVFLEYEFWFESFQNWQSEFFSIALMGILSIFFRQKGSPQSKKLSDPYWKTGGN